MLALSAEDCERVARELRARAQFYMLLRNEQKEKCDQLAAYFEQMAAHDRAPRAERTTIPDRVDLNR